MKKNKELDALVNEMMVEGKRLEAILTFIQDYGAYKTREKYKLSEAEYKKEIAQFRSGILMLQTSMLIASYMFEKDEKLKKEYEDIFKYVLDSVEEKLKVKSIKVKVPDKKIIY